MDYKALVCRWFAEVWNQQDRDAILKYMAPHCTTKVEGVKAPLSRDAFLDYHSAFTSALPDLRATVISVVLEGCEVVVHWRVLGTHMGNGLDIPASGKLVDFSGVSLFKFERDQIVQCSDHWNRGELIAGLIQLRVDEVLERAGLTEREAQVALLMGDRRSHTEIASLLRIRPNTARRHCEKVLMKLGVRRRQDVAQALGKIPKAGTTRHGSDLVPGT